MFEQLKLLRKLKPFSEYFYKLRRNANDLEIDQEKRVDFKGGY